MVTWASIASLTLPVPPSLPPVFHLSTSNLHFPLVLALSLFYHGALGPLIEALNNPSHCSIGQKTNSQGGRGPAHHTPVQPRL